MLSDIADFESGEPDVDSEHAKKMIGPSCDWGTEDFMSEISLVINAVHSEHADKKYKGIAGIYGGKEAGLVDFLDPTEVPGHLGYPAVYAGQDGDREKGKCALHVGIANDLTFTVIVQSENDPTQSCPAAQKVAASVLERLKGGA